MTTEVNPKNTWVQKLNYIKNLRPKPLELSGHGLKTLAYLVLPDLLGYNTSGHFFTVELKITRANKLKFSPHQIAFHVAHPKNTFILAEALGPRLVKLFHGSRIRELAACGFKLEACSLGMLAACASYFDLAWGLRLGACWGLYPLALAHASWISCMSLVFVGM